jgi:hypothetical protein
MSGVTAHHEQPEHLTLTQELPPHFHTSSEPQMSTLKSAKVGEAQSVGVKPRPNLIGEVVQ